MAKRDWQIRWKDELKEKLIRFNMSHDRRQLDERLKDVGLSIKFRKHQDYTEFDLANEEIAKTLNSEKCPYPLKSREALMWRWCKWKRTEDYGHFMDECIKAGKKYGFRWQTIFEALFLPQDEVKIEPFTKPQWYLEPIFHYMDREIIGRLEWKMPLGTSLRWNSDPMLESHDELSAIETYEAYNIFKVVLEFPLDYPREGTLEMAREAAKAARTLCKALGQHIKRDKNQSPFY